MIERKKVTGVEEQTLPAKEMETSNSAVHSIHTYSLLYRFFPVGSYTLTFTESTKLLRVEGTTCCCSCCIVSHEVSSVAELQVQRQALCCNWWRLVRDTALSFVFAFMFHLVPAVIWSPEMSLGSPSNHQLMGVVWFLGWPIWFAVLSFGMRPWGVMVKGSDDAAAVFVPFSSWKHATGVMEWWKSAQQQQHQQSNEKQPPPNVPRRPRLYSDLLFVFNWVVFLFLLVNMFVTGALVMKCIDRGCCKDDQDTLDCCVQTGYPDC